MLISFERRHSAGHHLRCHDSWGSESSSGSRDSAGSEGGGVGGGGLGGIGGGQSPGGGGGDWTGTRSERDAREAGNLSAGDPTGGVRGSSTGFAAGERGWGFGADGSVYGNLQNAAADLGVPASSLGVNGGTQGLISMLGDATPMGMLAKGLAYAQDNWGLPGYAMTADERAEMADRNAGRDHGGGATRGAVGMMEQVAQQGQPQQNPWNTNQSVNQVGLFNSPMSGLPGVNYQAPNIPVMRGGVQANSLWDMLRQIYGA